MTMIPIQDCAEAGGGGTDGRTTRGGRLFCLEIKHYQPQHVAAAGEREMAFRLACFHVLTKSCDRAIVNLFIHLEKLRLCSRFRRRKQVLKLGLVFVRRIVTRRVTVLVKWPLL